MDNILELHHVTKNFDGFCLKDISFSLPKGFIMGFVGPNGAGKTTTIKLMLNMLIRDSGDINIFGIDNITRQQEIKERIGIVLSHPFYVSDWTLMDVANAMAPFYKKWDMAVYKRLLGDFSLDPKKKVNKLSSGMNNKLMIALALSHDADLLLLDEPTSGLDAVARNELMEILRDFISNGDKGVLFSTHITSDLEKSADFITFINDGKLVYTGTKDDLMEHYRIVKGGADILTTEQRESMIGYRKHSVGFDGMIETSKLKLLPEDLVIEPVNIDEIVLRINAEGKNHE